MTKLMRNPQATHIDYAEFLGVISDNPKFCPCNIDGIVERKGKILLMEWKRQKEGFSEGQKLLLKALARSPDITVVIVRGNTDAELVIEEFFYVSREGTTVKAGFGKEEFFAWYREWYKYADGSDFEQRGKTWN